MTTNSHPILLLQVVIQYSLVLTVCKESLRALVRGVNQKWRASKPKSCLHFLNAIYIENMFIPENSHRATFCNNKLKALFLALMPPLCLAISILPQKAALAQITSQSCPAGTAAGSRNFITNGNFSTLGAAGAATFTSDLPYRGDNVYPDDPIGGVSIQSGFKQYSNNVVIGQPFPGDPVGAANATNNYLYSNPNQSVSGSSAFPNPIVWRQTVSGLQPRRTYRFISYLYNLLVPNDGGSNPIIVLGVDGFRSTSVTVLPRQQWIPVQFSFTTAPGQTSATLSIIDQANTAYGDDFGLTGLVLSECESIGVSKSAGTPVSNSNGTFTVPYTIVVKNYGSETLSNVQLNDDLSTTFANASGFVVSNIQSPSLTVNPGYDGRSTNSNLLGANNSLATGATATIAFNVNITPGIDSQGFGVFNNNVVATATVLSGAQVSDNSVNGTDPDPDGDGNPLNNSSPTPVTLTPNPQLGVAKTAGTSILDSNDGSFTIPYTITVRNTGNANLRNLQLTENLSQTFTGATNFSLVPNSLSGNGVTINPNFNGTTNTNLLAGADSLGVGANATITFSVRVNPGSNPGPYNNITIGNATGQNNISVTDQSTDGTNVDPDGDGNPTNNSVPTPITLTSIPRLGIAKAAAIITSNNDGSFIIPYTVTVNNAGNIRLNNVQVTENLSQTFPGASVLSIIPNTLNGNGVTVNPNFNGTTNTNLLAGTDSLAVGANGTITFNVRVIPGASSGLYNNTAVGAATGVNGTDVSDQSNNGTNPDPDGDGDPTNNNTPTPVSFTFTPRLGVAKAAGKLTNNGDGTFTVPYSIIVRNSGNTNLNSLQVTENLSQTFPGASVLSIEPNTLSGTGVTVNPNCNGTTNTNLLAGTDSLAIGAERVITFTVSVNPGNSPSPYNNTAVGNAIGANGVAVSDQSNNGIDVDPDGDGDPTNNNTPTPVFFTFTPRLGVAKAAGKLTNNGDGTFTVPYSIIVRNIGDINLNSLQVKENLSQTFPGASVLSIEPNTLSGTGVTVNPNFNGTTNTNLLAGTDSLAIGADRIITFSVRVNPGANPGPYNNTAVGAATGANGAAANDQSNNGIDVDPDGDGDPTNNNVPTPVTFTSNPKLGVAKRAGSLTSNSDGSFTIPYTINVRNVGDILLNNLQVIENLSQTFNGLTTFGVEANSLSGTGVRVNPNFNGISDTNLLVGTDSLSIGTNSTITFNVRVNPGNKVGPYNNTAVGNAFGANGGAVSDQSTDGTNIDPDNDGDPTNNSVPTPVNFASNIRLLKRITGVIKDGVPINSASFTSIEADADANAIAQAGLTPIGVRITPESNNLTSDDEIEYTIYFLSDGVQAATQVKFCDLIPTGTSYIPNSTIVQVGKTQLTSAEQFFPSLTPLPTGNSCLNPNNPNGAIIVNLGNISNTPGNNFGFIRLRVKID